MREKWKESKRERKGEREKLRMIDESMTNEKAKRREGETEKWRENK